MKDSREEIDQTEQFMHNSLGQEPDQSADFNHLDTQKRKNSSLALDEKLAVEMNDKSRDSASDAPFRPSLKENFNRIVEL